MKNNFAVAKFQKEQARKNVRSCALLSSYPLDSKQSKILHVRIYFIECT